MNMLNNKCRTSFVKPEILKKAKQANPRLYDIGCYNDNLALMLSPESDEVIRLEKKSRSKLSNLVRPFDYAKLNSLYDLFVPQHEKSSEQRFFSERSMISHINVQKEKKKESFQKQITFLETRMDESISMNKNCQSSLEIVNIQRNINTIITGVELCKQKIANRTYYGRIDPFIQNTIEQIFCPVITQINVGLHLFLKRLTEEMVDDLRYFNSLELEVDSLTSQLETQKHIQKHAINLELELQQCKEKIKNDMSFKVNKSKDFCKEREQYFEIQDLKAQLQDKGIVISELKKLIENLKGKYVDTKSNSDTSVSRPPLKSNPMGDRVLRSNSRGKKLEVEEHRRNVKLPKNKTSVTACNDSLNAKTLNVKFVSAMCDKCVMIDKHALCVLNSIAKPFKKTVASKSNKKPRNNVRKLYERFGQINKWSYIKFTPSGYMWKPKSPTGNVNLNLIEIVLFIVNSGCSKHMTGNLKLLINFVEKFLGTVKFGNDQIAPILGYGDLGNDLLTGSRGTDLYSITPQDSNSPNPICLMAKATSSQAWLWHRMPNHPPNPIYIWTHFLRSKDETPEVLIDFLRLLQRGLHAQVRANGVVKRWNCTPVEAARTMLSAAKVPLFFWAEAIATACFTQNRSPVIPRHEKTPYHIINDRKPSVKFFGSVCYIVRDGENLDKMKEKGDECIFVGYSNQSRAYRVFNKRTRSMELEHDSLSPGRKCQENVSHGDKTVKMSNELDLLFSPMFDELLNGSSKVVSKSSAVSAADALNERQHLTTPLNNHITPAPTSQTPTIAPSVISSENINQAEPHADNDQVANDE
nr:hypothetical protein [Tanacetum cinerariifolium]